MRYTLIAFLLLACCAGGPRGYVTHSDAVQYRSTVQVIVLCPWPVLGSGVIVDGSHVITAGHVVECAGDGPMGVMVSTVDDEQIVMSVDGGVDGVDVARLVALEGKPFHDVAPIRKRRLLMGETVCSIGTDGNLVTGIRKCGDVGHVNKEHFSMAIPVVPGNSGGPVFDRRGFLVGIVVAGNWTPGVENFGVGIPVGRFKELL